MNITESGLLINNFNVPAEYEGSMAVAKKLQCLIMMMPGTYPSAPEMGFGVSQYNFELIDKKLVSTMKDRLSEQIKTYLPTISGANIEIVKSSNDTLGIGVEFDGSMYMIRVEQKNTQTLSQLINLDKKEEVR